MFTGKDTFKHRGMRVAPDFWSESLAFCDVRSRFRKLLFEFFDDLFGNRLRFTIRRKFWTLSIQYRQTKCMYEALQGPNGRWFEMIRLMHKRQLRAWLPKLQSRKVVGHDELFPLVLGPVLPFRQRRFRVAHLNEAHLATAL